MGAILDIAQPRDSELDQPEEFAAAVEPHLPLLARVAGRLGPPDRREDVLQDALLRAWAHRRQYDAQKGPIVNWLLKIVANEARRSLGRQRRAWPIGMPTRPMGTSSDERLDLQAATERLPERQRLAIDCFYYLDLSVSQTAAAMGCSEGNVKSALSDARKRLRLELEKT